MAQRRGSAKKNEGAVHELKRLVRNFSGYEDVQVRQAADKLVREHLVALLDETRGVLHEMQLHWGREGTMEQSIAVDRLLGRLAKARDDVRFADYSPTGWLEAAEMDQKQLERLYEHDLGLRQQVIDVGKAVEDLAAAAADDVSERMDVATEQIAKLQRAIDRRGEIIAELAA